MGMLHGGIWGPALTSPAYQIKHTITVLVMYCQLMGGFDEFITFSCHFEFEHGTWKHSPFFYGCHFSFKFRHEISFEKTEIHNLQVHPWSLLKLFAMPLCINISVSNYNFFCETLNVCKVIKQHVHLTSSYQKECPTFEPPSWACHTKKSSLLILKYFHWPKCEFCCLQ
jgi:hypothetical protein